jgi:hypothetical protein
MARGSRPVRAARPHRASGYGTTQARGATFANLSRGVSISVKTTPSGPFTGALAAKFGQYSPICRGWIHLTLADPHFGPRVNFHNVGTGPELVTCGYFLARNYIPGRNITFQEDKIFISDRTRHVRKEFIVDVEVDDAWGRLVYLNIDGAFFHTRTELQEFKDHIRDMNESRTGIPIDVPGDLCYDDQTFISFMQREGVVA